MRDYHRLEAFLNERLKDIYPEPDAQEARSIIEQTVPQICKT